MQSIYTFGYCQSLVGLWAPRLGASDWWMGAGRMFRVDDVHLLQSLGGTYFSSRRRRPYHVRYKDGTNDNFTSSPWFFRARGLYGSFHGAIIESIIVQHISLELCLLALVW